MLRKNHLKKWCVYPAFQIREVCDGLSEGECAAIGNALLHASARVAELNASEGTQFLFETKGVVE
ncbi:MAG: hypothetical protein ACO3QV_07255 [Candidatus Nanopelagicaceae bacterium]